MKPTARRIIRMRDSGHSMGAIAAVCDVPRSYVDMVLAGGGMSFKARLT